MSKLLHPTILLITHTGCCSFCEMYDHVKVVMEVEVCKGLLLTEQVNLLSWLCVEYFYDHAVINSHNNFFSMAMECCLHDENTYRPRGCDMGVI